MEQTRLAFVSIVLAFSANAELQNAEVNGIRMIFSGGSFENWQDVDGGDAHGWILSGDAMHSGDDLNAIEARMKSECTAVTVTYKTASSDKASLELPGGLTVRLLGGTRIRLEGLKDRRYLEMGFNAESNGSEWHVLSIRRFDGRVTLTLDHEFLYEAALPIDQPIEPGALRIRGNGDKSLFKDIWVSTGEGGLQIRRSNSDGSEVEK